VGTPDSLGTPPVPTGWNLQVVSLVSRKFLPLTTTTVPPDVGPLRGQMPLQSLTPGLGRMTTATAGS
jgi:hypothetical protein